MYAFLSRGAVAPAALATSLLAGLLMLGSSAASANTYQTFTSPTDFAATAGDLVTYAFPEGDGTSLPRPYLLGPLGFGSTQHFTRVYLENNDAYGAGQTYLATIGIPGANATIATQVDGIYAVSFNLGTFDGADTITVKMNYYDIVGTFTTSGGVGTSTFFGITSADPITQISFTAANGTEIDFLGFTVQSPVPEPATPLLALAGMAVLGTVFKRRRHG